MCKGVPESEFTPNLVGRKLTQSWPHLGSGPACLSWAKLNSSYQLTSLQGHLSPTWATFTSLHASSVHAKLLRLCLTLRQYGLKLLCPWDSPGKNTGVSCHALLQGIFLTQGSNPHLSCLPSLAGGFFTTSTTWEACHLHPWGPTVTWCLREGRDPLLWFQHSSQHSPLGLI